MEDMLRGLGAAIRGSVSRKTDYLCQGTHLEDGRDPDTSGKSKKAIEFNVKIVKYEDLDALMVRLTDKTIG
jgi:replication factor C subunit 1